MSSLKDETLSITEGESDTKHLPNDPDELLKYKYSPVQNPFKAGNSYVLSGQKFMLPSPATLRPNIDTTSGTLDSWPAHTTGSSGTKHIYLSKNKELIVLDEEKLGKPQITPKPKLLHNLESFLKKQLTSLGVTKPEPNELRLQAHRQVFDTIIEKFSTYAPLLQAIKGQYEVALAQNREQIRKLEPLKQLLITATDESEQKLEGLKAHDKPELAALKQENLYLHQEIERLKEEQLTVKAEVENLQGKLSAQYEEYRDEADARKLLVIDINELRYRQEDLLQQLQTANQYQAGEDPTMMKIALRRAQKDEAMAQERLTELIAKFSDVTPRREFEILHKKIASLKDSYQKKMRDLEIIKAEHETLGDVHKQVVQQKEEFFAECERLRRSATPRPDWEQCADYITGGIQRWQQLSGGKSSDELVSVLLQEIGKSSAPDVGAPEYFEGQGDVEGVLAHLRYEGQVINRHFNKREISSLIRDVWTEKEKHDQKAGGIRMPLTEYLVKYLDERFPLKQMVVEWCYNIHDACQRFSHDEQVSMFLGILTEEIDEQVYHEQMNAISVLYGFLKKAVDSESPEKLSRDMFKLVLSDFFEEKTDSDLELLVKSAERELTNDNKPLEVIEFNNLFIQDNDGKFGGFVDEFIRQIEQEKVSFVTEILKEISAKHVSVGDLQRAITLADPEIDTDNLNKYLLWAFRVKERADLEYAQSIPVDDMEQRLINGHVKRTGSKF